jgi:hypothetical protein
MLMVMSNMYPHMISGTYDGFLVMSCVGLCQSGFSRLVVGHGETPWCNWGYRLWGDEFVTCLLDWLRHRTSPLLSACQTWVQSSLLLAFMSYFPHTCIVATISILKFASIVASGQTKCWSQIKGTSRMNKKETMPTPPSVAPVEAPSALRFHRCLIVIFFLTQGSFCKSLVYKLPRYCIYLLYCCYTCDLNIIVTCIEASILISQIQGVTEIHINPKKRKSCYIPHSIGLSMNLSQHHCPHST